MTNFNQVRALAIEAEALSRFGKRGGELTTSLDSLQRLAFIEGGLWADENPALKNITSVTIKPVEITATDKRWGESDAAHEWTTTLEHESVYKLNGAPLWDRISLTASFHAGIAWARKRDAEMHKGSPVTLQPGLVGEGQIVRAEQVRITASNVAVDPGYHWQPMATCPVHTKVQLIGQGGLPVYGKWDGVNSFYVGWAPIPTRAPGG